MSWHSEGTAPFLACFCCFVNVPNAVSAIGGECGVKFEVPASGESTRWCDDRDTAHADGSGRDMKAVDEEWLERIGRMGRRAFKYEHDEREKKEKRLAARKKKKTDEN